MVGESRYFKSIGINYYGTRSSFVSEDNTHSRRGRSIFGKVPITFILFAVSLGILAFLGTPNNDYGTVSPPIIANIWPYVAADALVFGALFIFVGWLEFSLNQSIKDIPTIKIDAAAAGVNEIVAMFVPEKESLLSPISKQQCIFYSTLLQKYVNAGKNSEWQTCGQITNGTPALLTDGTGYLAINLDEADMDIDCTNYYPLNSNGEGLKTNMDEGKKLQDGFEGLNAEKNFPMQGVMFSKSGGRASFLEGAQLRVLEWIIPTNTNYFVMGRIGETIGTFNDKQVKRIEYDQATKLLTVRRQSKKQIERDDTFLYLVSFGTGVILFLLGLAIFGFA